MMPDFANMTSEKLVTHLDSVKGATASNLSHHDGPVTALYPVDLKHLPPLTAHIAREVAYSKGKVIDFSVADWMWVELVLAKLIADDALLPRAIGAARTTGLHSSGEDGVKAFNARVAIGISDPMSLTGIGIDQKYSLNPDTPGSMRSWHQNDKKALPKVACEPSLLSGKSLMYHKYVEYFKGLQNKQKQKEVSQVYTGYIEYTCGGWREGVTQGRLVYDYVGGHFYLTPDHYTTWYRLNLDS